MRIIVIVLFIVFGITSIRGQYNKLYKSLHDLSYKLTELYDKGHDIQDCNMRMTYWYGIWKYAEEDEQGMTDLLISSAYFFRDSLTAEELSSLDSYADGVREAIEFLDICADEGFSSNLCLMCSDARRNIVENYLNQLYIYFDHIEANKGKYNE